MNMNWSSYTHSGRTKAILLLVLILISFSVGFFLSGRSKTSVEGVPIPGDSASLAVRDAASGNYQKEALKAQLWTCSMHPQIKLPKPGKCPICYMDLIPLETGSADSSKGLLRRYSMSDQAKKLAEVETSEVMRQRAKIEVRMLGMVYEDETRAAVLTSRVDGRLDEIYVNFTGVQVTKGDPMVTIWSPTLIKSQVELFETIRGSEPDESVIRGAEEKLIQLGLTREQISEIKEKKKPILNVTLKAPISGTVMKKFAVLGQFVKEGTEMYIINDLSHVWIKLDAYETDIPWIRYGQDVTFTTKSVPGRKFSGKVLFIDPMLDTKTRSVKVRVEAANPDLSLKPGMFVTAELQSEIDQSGRVIKAEWAGKFICPVHPRDEASPVPGTCPESKMALKPASAFGYVDEKDPVFPLVVPASAPLITGKRALVYVEVPQSDRPTYEARDVVLGPRAGDNYLIYEGLKEGERVVSRGNFKIDSAMQILARPSMMNPVQATRTDQAQEKIEEQVIRKLTVPRSFLKELTPIIGEYLKLKEALVDEDAEAVGKHTTRLGDLLKDVNAQSLDGRARGTWNDLSTTMMNGLDVITRTSVIESRRKAFDPVSEAFVQLLMGFRHVMSEPLVVFHCPMAFDRRGAYWVQAGEDRRNPYFGRKPFNGQDMLTCGEIVEKIPPEQDVAPSKTDFEDSGPSQPEPLPSSESSDLKHGDHSGDMVVEK